MKCAVLQPSYLPWRGYFDQIGRSDVFVFYDDVQYDKHGWRNRNRIKTAQGTAWITVPVISKGNVAEQIAIKDVRINNDQPWQRKQLSTLRQAYGKAPYFETYFPIVEAALMRAGELLVDLTIPLTIDLAAAMAMEPRFVRSSTLDVEGDRMDRLILTLRAVEATHYVSGPSASSYLDEGRLREAGISLEYMSYDYPEYEQLHQPYDPNVSILDLLFMKGPEARALIET